MRFDAVKQKQILYQFIPVTNDGSWLRLQL